MVKEIELILDGEGFVESIGKILSQMPESLKKQYLKQGEETLTEKEQLEFLKALLLLLQLEFYLKTLELKYLAQVSKEKELSSDLTVLLRELKQKMDKSVRLHLLSKKIEMNRNLYIGYDTEYKTLENNKSTLLSMQLSVSGRWEMVIEVVKA